MTKRDKDAEKAIQGWHVRFKHVREDMRLTPSELSRRLKVSSTYVSNIEAGKTTFPSADIVYRLCKAAAVRASWLLFNDGPMRRPPVEKPRPVEIERVPVQLASTVLQVTEEMQFCVKYARDGIVEVRHIEEWVGAMQSVRELAVTNPFMRSVPTDDVVVSAPSDSADDAPAYTGGGNVARLTPPRQSASKPAPANNVSRLPDRALPPGKLGYAGPQWKDGQRPKPRADGLLRAVEVCDLAGISTPTFYVWQKSDPNFPKNRAKKGDPFPAFNKREVEQWIAGRLMADKRAPKAKQA